jgi:large subunit ribosomal protein L4
VAKIAVLTLEGGKAKSLDLPDGIFDTPLNSGLMHEAVLAFRAAGRAGTHATKNRSDVRGGGKKPWKQKKTGRSRHGSIRSPIWRGGGTVFGPKPHSYAYAFPRKKRQGALRSALSAKVRDGKLLVVESLALPQARTKDLLAAMESWKVGRSTLLIDEPGNRNLELSARNIPGVKTTLSTALNIVDVLKYDTLVLTEAAVRRVSEVLAS